MSGQPKVARRMIENGWEFRYEPATRFIGAYHPSGGKRSIAEVVGRGLDREEIDEIGQAIADTLNGNRE